LAYLIPLDKTPSIHINHHTPSTAFAPEQVKPAHTLAKRLNNVSGVLLLVGRQLGDEARFFAVRVPPDEAVHHGRLASLGMTE
jgi:hypothetical protein